MFADVIKGPDKRDPTTIPEHLPAADFQPKLNISNVTVGLPKEYHHDVMSPEIVETWRHVANIFVEAGANVKEVSRSRINAVGTILNTHSRDNFRFLYPIPKVP